MKLKPKPGSKFSYDETQYVERELVEYPALDGQYLVMVLSIFLKGINASKKIGFTEATIL